MLRFFRHPRNFVGRQYHRSGWPFVMGCLAELRSADGVLFDDFAEATFCYRPNSHSHTEPWIGVFHHPWNYPDFANHSHPPQAYMQSETWAQSEEHLVGAIVLSEYAAEYYRSVLACPVATILHPIGSPPRLWQPRCFELVPRIVQVGVYLRNTRAIDQVPSSEEVRGQRSEVRYERLKLWRPEPWYQEYDQRVRAHWRRDGSRCEYLGVTEFGHVSNFAYDELLASAAVLSEVFDASANNVVLDCLIRNTPLFVNAHPAVCEYLGEDYPLYFEHPHEIPDLLKDVPRAHEYLADQDKIPFTGQAWRDAVAAFVRSLTW